MEDEILLSLEPSSGGFWDFLNFDFSFLQSLIEQVGTNPLYVMFWLLVHGGWIVLVMIAFLALRSIWLHLRRVKAEAQKDFILLAIDVPRMSEQTVKAVDNMFAHLAGAHSPSTFKEKWFEGKMQDALSMEIISIEGHVQYLVRCLDKLRDLVEATIYAQYPDAEIAVVDDYVHTVPSKYPDDAYDLFGTEMTNVQSDVYPLKSYLDFEHSLTGEYKDPLAVLLEAFSRLGPGEQAWYQIIVTPIAQTEFSQKAKKEIMKLKGEKPPMKKNIVEKALDLPVTAMGTVAGAVLGGESAPADKKKEDGPRMLLLSPGEKNVLEAVERKMSKIQFLCKVRFIYVAKKEVFSKPKILQSFIGAIKQFNTNDLQSLKPEGKKVGVNGTLLFFKERRNNGRKRRLYEAYKTRSNWMGLNEFHLGTDELASLWHLPVILNVKAPQLKKTEAKKTEPPTNLPFA